MRHTGDYELDEINMLEQECQDLEEDNKRLEEENRKLREFKAKQEEMMFLIWASIELAEPKTYRDAEKLQKGKEIYEKLYKKELYYLREENRKLKEDIDNWFNRETDLRNKRADSLLENKDLRDKIEELETDYDRLKVAFEDVVSWK